LNGGANYDICSVCSGGTTGIEPETNSENCIATSTSDLKTFAPKIFPNPTSDVLNIQLNTTTDYQIKITDSIGQIVLETSTNGSVQLNIKSFKSGNYFVTITDDKNTWNERFIKL